MIDHILSIGKYKIKIGKYRNYYLSYLVPGLKCLTLNNILTLKLGFRSLKSLKIVPFKSFGKVFYSRSVVTMSVSCIVSEI